MGGTLDPNVKMLNNIIIGRGRTDGEKWFNDISRSERMYIFIYAYIGLPGKFVPYIYKYMI